MLWCLSERRGRSLSFRDVLQGPKGIELLGLGKTCDCLARPSACPHQSKETPLVSRPKDFWAALSTNGQGTPGHTKRPHHHKLPKRHLRLIAAGLQNSECLGDP